MKKRAPLDLHPKLAAAGVAQAIVIVVNAILHGLIGGFDPSPEVVVAEVVIVGGAAGYIKTGD